LFLQYLSDTFAARQKTLSECSGPDFPASISSAESIPCPSIKTNVPRRGAS
jgi:hypothetical protein